MNVPANEARRTFLTPVDLLHAGDRTPFGLWVRNDSPNTLMFTDDSDTLDIPFDLDDIPVDDG